MENRPEDFGYVQTGNQEFDQMQKGEDWRELSDLSQSIHETTMHFINAEDVDPIEAAEKKANLVAQLERYRKISQDMLDQTEQKFEMLDGFQQDPKSRELAQQLLDAVIREQGYRLQMIEEMAQRAEGLKGPEAAEL